MPEFETHALSEISDIRISNVDKKSVAGESRVALCNYMDVYSNEYIGSKLDFMQATATQAEIERFKVEDGDVLITKDSETPYDIGIPAVVVEEIEGLVCAYHLALLKPDQSRVNSIFLSKQLAQSETARYFSRFAAGSTRYGLSSKAIASTPVRLPSLGIQRKIACILQTADRTIEKTEALIDKYEQIKSGLMHDLFTRGIGPDGQLRPPREQAPELYQEAPIGWLPKEWKYESVGCLLKGVEQGWSPDCESEQASMTEWGVLKTTAVQWGGFKKEENKKLPKHLQPKVGYAIKKGDVLLTRAGPNSRVGVVAIVTEDPGCLLLSDKLYRLITNECVKAEYFALALSSDNIQRYLDGFKTGLAESQTNISQSIIRRLIVGLPSFEEQTRIIEGVYAAFRKLDQMNAELEKYRTLRFGLMHDLLTGKVPVQVEPENEPEAAHV